ncbi:Glycosyltransferase involved in cell wall bisynthesis [Novosphingobium sp. CF614]|uniref:glycosyltransferase n=1 Tax=Novosphingobium sp. CF614 TaxID=1884364 RepID=UPI0008E417C4|nr:glycosyltransferase [Novosphingobium sp. CF614]SFG20594.1 Glycosyltransferase involved in cell wall bisynthesis [Novosphingobium sp. CF614]
MAKIALLLPNLEAGGAERVTLTLAAEFLAMGDSVDLLVLRREGALVDAVPAGVRLVVLGANRLRNAAGPLSAYCRRERPDGLLASIWPLTSIAVWAARRWTRAMVVEHNTLSVEAWRWPVAARALLRPILRWSHPRAAACVAVSVGAAVDLARLCGLPEEAVKAIHNPIPPPAPAMPGNAPDWGGTGRRILTVGRLKPQKNHRLLLDAFARMARPEDRLAIVGEGGEHETIERTAEALGIADRLLLPGYTADPGAWYNSADLFVLSSDYEGFANVVAEALGHGLTVVSTDCPNGPAEILAGLGRLVPVGDAAAMAEAIISALAAPDDPAAARSRAAAFAPAPIARRYRALLLGSPL